MLLQILLVVVLGHRKGAGVDNLGRNRSSPLAARRDGLLHAQRDLALLGRRDEDGGAILRTDVVPLAVFGRRVMHSEEPLLEKVLVGDLARVENDPNRLGIAGLAGADVLVS